MDEISHQPLTQWERGDVQEGLRAEPWISPSIVWDQDGGFGGHCTGGRVGTSEREATKDLCIVICKFRIFTLFLIVLFKSPVF